MLEHNKKFLKMNFNKKYEQKIKNDHSLPNNICFDEFLERIESLTKQQNKFQFMKPYIKWIVQKYVTNGIRYFEDIPSKTIPTLLIYDALKRKNKLKPDHKNINQIKTLNDLMDIIDEYKTENTKSNKEQDKDIEQKFYESGKAKLIYNDSEIKVVVPKTEGASCFFGKNTKWCTAAVGENMFLKYSSKGDLYIIIIKKSNEKYQFHFETDQFMNERDEPINPVELGEKYPKLYDIFGPISIIFNKNPSEENQLNAVKRNGLLIQYIKNPSEKVQLAAVIQDANAIEYIENPSEEVKLNAVKQNVYILQYIKNPSKELQLAAVRKNGYAVEFIENPCEEVQLAAVNQNGLAIQYIENPNEKIQIAAINENVYAIQYIKNPTENTQLELIKINASLFYYIKNPTERVQLEAVKKDGRLIYYIENPSEEVQLAAIENNPEAIKCIKKPTRKVLELVSLF